MKIKLINIGPIREFEIDLSKKISLIYGKNNIGKSYAISVVYMLLKSFPMITKKSDLEFAIQRYTAFIREPQHLYQSGTVVFGSELLLSSVRAVLEYLMNDWIRDNFILYLKSSYGDLKNVKNALTPNPGLINVDSKTLQFSFHLFENLSEGGKVGQLLINKESIKNIDLSNENPESLSYKILTDFFREVRLYTTSFHYIPAVRSGYYLGLSNLGSIIAKINQYQGVIGSQSFTLPNTTVPVSDFYSTISNKLAFTSADEYNYKSVVDKIEQNILKGTVQIDKESGRILYFSNELKRTFDLSQVSSMVSELSIITAYLKFIIWDHVSLDQLDGEPSMSVGVFPTLFIEEPESHLHPEAQIKLMEYFVELAKMGLKIIMTTHSDYMSNKMGNLILAGKIEANNTGSYLLEKKKEGTACSKRKMRATDEGIEDANFHSAIEKLYKERIKLNDKYYGRIDRANKKS
jgi:predicted ATP-dependent endonuclease of OLD family